MLHGSADDLASPQRSYDLAAWADLDVPLLRDPRALVTELVRIHAPVSGTAVLAVLGAEGQLVGGASFVASPGKQDGWHLRNALLGHLRRIVPDGLRRSHPSHTAALMLCRPGSPDWTEQDGSWMWALRDAGGLHGVRCGAYLTLTEAGWTVLGDERTGRNPHLGSRPADAVRTVHALPEPELRRERPGPRQDRHRPETAATRADDLEVRRQARRTAAR